MDATTRDAMTNSIIRQMMDYAASKGVTGEQWEEILRRFESEVDKVLNGEQ